MAQRLVILGSTGSIGTSALDVVSHLRDEFEVVGLSAGRNVELLAAQAAEFGVPSVAVADPQRRSELAAAVGGGCRVLAGPEGLIDLVRHGECDFVLSAIVGAAGLPPTLEAVRLGKTIGLANKETLVVAGSLILPLAQKTGAVVLPIDSEHSAVFQAIQAGRPDEVQRVWLTASGGPFRTYSAEQLAAVTLDEALRHPTWSMGPKITIDSATMMNKALEVIEAWWLFGLEPEAIRVLVHPESIVHSLVEFCDGSVIAQLGAPDMRTPIQYALTYPRRVESVAERLDLTRLGTLSFEEPDERRFPALGLGYEVVRQGGSAGAVLNGANEAAVGAFRAGRIGFCQIAELTGEVLARHQVLEAPSLDELFEADAWAREEVDRCLSRVGSQVP